MAESNPLLTPLPGLNSGVVADGGLMSLAFAKLGCAGIVTDRRMRDATVPSEVAPQVIEWAEEVVRLEKRIVAASNAGEAREKVFTANPRFAHIRRLR